MLNFYYDIVCPYAYMAFSVLRKQDIFKKKNIVLKPILLGGLFKFMEQETNPNSLLSPLKSAYLKQDIIRQAAYFSVPLSFHERHPIRSLMAMRLLSQCPAKDLLALSTRLYHAYWQENLDIDNPTVIDEIAKEYKIIVNYEISKHKLIIATKDAFDNKVFGVPTLSINNRLYFGADRLELIKHDLGLDLPHQPWQAAKPPIDFYFDFSSPYSYLAYREMEHAEQAGVLINYKPVLLGAIFRSLNITSVPMLSTHPHKASYYIQDMQDWAHHRGLNFNFNTRFPLRSVTALRVALLEPRASKAMFHAAWGEDLDIGDDQVLGEVLNKAGFSGENLLREAQEHRVKEQLKTNTDQAISLGIFGLPAFMVNNQLIFGQDRFAVIKKLS